MGKLYNDDCLKVLSTLNDESVDMVFADPPFNLSKVYDEGINDNLSTSQYIEWCYKWIEECIRILKPGGSLFIYNIPKWTIVFSEFLNKRMTLRSWIAVDMKFSLPISGRLYPAHYGVLYYVKGEKPKTFNNQRIPLLTCRHCGGEIKDYGGYKSKMNPLGVNVSDVWTDIYPVRHKSQKNREYNELSIKMLDRIISMSTEPGDIVFDPFGGSGTTYVVAEMTGRRWLGSEIGNCNIISERFANIDKDRAILSKVYEEKNVLFTDSVKEIRKKNGFWLCEDFKYSE
jgi:site-specific DNA-methyltransferase (adenine-specific)